MTLSLRALVVAVVTFATLLYGCTILSRAVSPAPTPAQIAHAHSTVRVP